MEIKINTTLIMEDVIMKDWKEYTIANGHYSRALYQHHKLILKGGFYIAKRLFKIIDIRLRNISVIKQERGHYEKMQKLL